MTLGLYIVWTDRGGQWTHSRRIQAHSPKMAAEAYANRRDAESNEYSVVRGEPMDVVVDCADGSGKKKYTVHGESVRQYNAEERK